LLLLLLRLRLPLLRLWLLLLLPNGLLPPRHMAAALADKDLCNGIVRTFTSSKRMNGPTAA
jgi:hypothetical protein